MDFIVVTVVVGVVAVIGGVGGLAKKTCEAYINYSGARMILPVRSTRCKQKARRLCLKAANDGHVLHVFTHCRTQKHV